MKADENELDFILSQSEGPFVEFKRSISLDIAKEIVGISKLNDQLSKLESMRRNKKLADLFHRIGEVEKIGMGINRIRNAALEAGLIEPEFTFDSFFTVKFDRPGYKTTEATPHVTPHVTLHVIDILKECKQPRFREELMHILDLSDREHFRKTYLVPLLEGGWIEMTIPEKPRSIKQRYKTTEEGKKILEEGNL